VIHGHGHGQVQGWVQGQGHGQGQGSFKMIENRLDGMRVALSIVTGDKYEDSN